MQRVGSNTNNPYDMCITLIKLQGSNHSPLKFMYDLTIAVSFLVV